MKLGKMFRVFTGTIVTMGLVLGLAAGSSAENKSASVSSGGLIKITIQDEFGNSVSGATLRYKTSAMSATQTITVTTNEVTLGGSGTALSSAGNGTWTVLDAYHPTKGYLLVSANVAQNGSSYSSTGENTDQTIGMKFAFKVTVVNDDGQPIYSAASITSTFNITSTTTNAVQQAGTNIYGVPISLNVGTVTINSSGLGSVGYLASAYVANTCPTDVASAQISVRVTSNYTFKINSLKNEYGVTLSAKLGNTVSLNYAYEGTQIDAVEFTTVTGAYGIPVPTRNAGDAIAPTIKVNVTGYLVSRNTVTGWTNTSVTKDFALIFPVKVTSVKDELGASVNLFTSAVTADVVNVVVGSTTYIGTINLNTGQRSEWGIAVPPGSGAATLSVVLSPNHQYVKTYTKSLTIGSDGFSSPGSQLQTETAVIFATKIKLQNQLGTTLNLESASSTVNVQIGAITSFLVTGSADQMATGSAYIHYGIAYMLVSPNLIGTGNVGVTANKIGYLKYSTSQTTVTDNTSTTFVLANRFPLTISMVQSEAGTSITLTRNDVVRVATANAPLPFKVDYNIATISTFNVSDSTWYISVSNNSTDATFNVRFLSRGYLWTTDNAVVTISNQSADNPTQQVAAFTRATGDGLRYPVKVSYVQDQLGATISASTVYFTASQASGDYTVVDSSLDIMGTVASGSEIIFLAIAPSDNNVETVLVTPAAGMQAGPITLNAFSNGYVRSTILIPTTNEGMYPISVTGNQTVVSFSAAALKGLNYNFTITSRNLHSELGITLNDVTTRDVSSGYPFTLYTTSDVVISPLAVSLNSNTWYIAIPTQTVKYKYDTSKFIKSGASVTFDVNDNYVCNTANVTLNYPIKITISNELGVTIDLVGQGFMVTANGATITWSGQVVYVASTENQAINIAIASSNYVFVTANLTAPGGSDSSEYVNSVVASGNVGSIIDFNDLGGSNGDNGVITYVKGIKYPLRVDVSDELGRAVNGSGMLTINIGAAPAIVSRDNSFYFNVVTTDQTLTINARGYVVGKAKTVSTNNHGQTRIVLSGETSEYLFATAVNPGSAAGDGLTYARGLDYTAVVQQITDKFGNEIKIESTVSASITTGDIMIATMNFSGDKLYLAIDSNSSTTNLSFVASGDVAVMRPGFIQSTLNLTIGGSTSGTNGKVENLTYVAASPSLDQRLNIGTYSPRRVLFYRWKPNTFSDSYTTTSNSTNLIGEEVTSYKGLDYAVSINADLLQNQLGYSVAGIITPNLSNSSLTIFNNSINITVYSVSGSVLTALTRDYDMSDGFSGYFVTTNIYSSYPTNLAAAYPFNNLGWYVAVSASGNYKVRLSGCPGYVGTDSGEITVTYNLAQQTASYLGSSTGLKYALVADVRTSVTANTSQVVDAMVKINYSDGTSLNATFDAGTSMYYIAATKNGSIVVTHSNYVDTLADNYNFSVVTQTVLVFSGSDISAPSIISGDARVTLNGLAYPLKVLIKDELGSTMTADITVTWNNNGTEANLVKYTKDNVYYFRGDGSIPTKTTLAVSKTGYVTVRSSELGIGLPLTNATSNRTTRITLTGRSGTDLSTVTAGSTVERNGFPYSLKIVLYDEIGNAVTADTITYGGVAPATSVNNTYYFASTDTANLLVEKSGYVSISQNATSPQLGSGIAGQTSLTLTGTSSTELVSGATINIGATGTRNGLKYGIKVTGAGPSDSGSTDYRFTLDGATYNAKAVISGITTVYSSDVAYLAATGGTLTLSKKGYTAISTTNISSTTTTQNVFSFTGTANGLAGKAEIGLTNTLPTVTGLDDVGRVLRGGRVTVNIRVANYGPYEVSLNSATLAFRIAGGTTGVTSDYTVSLPVTTSFAASRNPSVVNTNDYLFGVAVGATATADVIEVMHMFDANQVGSPSVQAGWTTGQGIANSLFTIGTWRVATDVTKPTVALSSPASGTVNSTIVNLRGTAADNAGLSKVWVYVGGTANAMTLVSSGNGVTSTEWYGQITITSNSLLTIYAYDATDLASTGVTVNLRTGEQTVSDVGSISGLKVVLPLSSTGQTVTIDASNLASTTMTTSSASSVIVRGVSYYIPPKPAAEATRNVLTMIDIVANNGSISTFNATVNLQIPFSGQASDVGALYYTSLTTNSSVSSSAWTLVAVSDYTVVAGLVSVSTNHFTVWMISGTATSDVTTPTVGAIKVSGVALNGTTIYTQKPTYVVASISDNVGIVTSTVRYTVDNVVIASGNDVTFTGTQASFASVVTLSVGTHTVHFSLSDTSGNSVTESATFNVELSVADGSVYNYPNPVRNGVTTVNFTLSSAKNVDIYIYNVIGEMVRAQRIVGASGVNSWVWNVDDSYGYGLANGLYFVHVVCGSDVIGKAKVLVISN